jgi:hypothetical protein
MVNNPVTCLVVDARRLDTITVDGPAVKIRMKQQASQNFPLRRLGRIHVIGTANIDLEVFLHCAEHQVPVAFFTARGKLRCQLYFPVFINTLLSHWFEHVEFDIEIKQLYQNWLEYQTRHNLARLSAGQGCQPHEQKKLELLIQQYGRKAYGRERWDAAMEWLSGMLVAHISQIIVEYGLSNQSRGKRKLLEDISPLLMLWLGGQLLMASANQRQRPVNGITMSAFYQQQSASIDTITRQMLIQLITRLESIV